mmetsp:Transcript_23266/g.53897  ORF Transcript_23266/g.53897 Transcript_23266/m.53897 type:complete len:107 (-) Transcript_23266:128-448(-)
MDNAMELDGIEPNDGEYEFDDQDRAILDEILGRREEQQQQEQRQRWRQRRRRAMRRSRHRASVHAQRRGPLPRACQAWASCRGQGVRKLRRTQSSHTWSSRSSRTS